MNVLIVVSRHDLGVVWSRHLERSGGHVDIALSQDEAVDILHDQPKDVIILDLTLRDGAALAVSDFASYRQPDAKVIFVTARHFFSDGSIFQHCANACACLGHGTPPEDLAALVEHHANH